MRMTIVKGEQIGTTTRWRMTAPHTDTTGRYWPAWTEYRLWATGYDTIARCRTQTVIIDGEHP